MIVFLIVFSVTCVCPVQPFFGELKHYTSQMYATTRTGWCKFAECCDESWQHARLTDLKDALRKKVYGQHIAVEIIVSALQSHIRGNNNKPLVLSFHGWPGGGKNYVAKIIKENLFEYGEKDKHIHVLSGRIHFRLDEHVPLYQDNLMSWVKGNISRCGTSMFVFDEVDKMPSGVLSCIKPYLDHHSYIDGIDFRNAIFMFLSNTGSNAITQKMIEFYKSGRKREELRLEDFEDAVSVVSFNEKGGLHSSDVISSNVIDHYIPFLPLEKEHVELCIHDAFHLKGASDVTDDDIKSVLTHVTYGPEEMQIFSKSGCKRVLQKVAVALEKKNYGVERNKHHEL